MNFCEFIKNIEQDPSQVIKNLTIGQFYDLQKHLLECNNCSDTVDRILEQHPVTPDNKESDWSKTRFN